MKLGLQNRFSLFTEKKDNRCEYSEAKGGRERRDSENEVNCGNNSSLGFILVIPAKYKRARKTPLSRGVEISRALATQL